MRIISLNLNGIRSAFSKGLPDWLAQQQADIVCVQELKAQAADMTQEMLDCLATTAISIMPKKRATVA